ncbi:MAG: hypothetical protein ACLVC5_09510, partial [Clostridia bacterium]
EYARKSSIFQDNQLIFLKLPYFPLNLGKNLGKTWESIFSQVPFETSLLSSKENEEKSGKDRWRG